MKCTSCPRPASSYRLAALCSSLPMKSGRSAWSFQVQPDGTLDHGEPFYRLETSDHSAASQASAVTIDSDHYEYFATSLGIQVGDLQGRTAFIVANPNGARMSSLDFGGCKDSGCYTRLPATRCFGGPSAAQAPKCGDSDRMAKNRPITGHSRKVETT